MNSAKDRSGEVALILDGQEWGLMRGTSPGR